MPCTWSLARLAAPLALAAMGAGFPALAQTVPPPNTAMSKPGPVRNIEDFMASLEPATITLSGDGKTIHFVGDITPGVFVTLSQLLRKSPKVTTLHLSSDGGDVLEGYMIGNLARVRQLDTYAEYFCASACTLAFLGGHSRVLGPNARLGFHQSYTIEDGKVRPGGSYGEKDQLEQALRSGDSFRLLSEGTGDDKFVRALRRAGLGDEFISKVLKTPPTTFWEPDPEELLREKVVTRLAVKSELPEPPDARSLDYLAGALKAMPFWQAYSAHDPAGFDRELRIVWRRINAHADWEKEVRLRMSKIEDGLVEKLAAAPDPVVAHFSLTLANWATQQRIKSFPACNTGAVDLTPPSRVTGEPPLEASALDQEYTALMQNTQWQAAMPIDEARKQLRKNAGKLRSTGLFYSYGKDTPACVLGIKMFEAVSLIDEKHRLPLFRAIAAIGTEEDRAKVAQADEGAQ